MENIYKIAAGISRSIIEHPIVKNGMIIFLLALTWNISLLNGYEQSVATPISNLSNVAQELFIEGKKQTIVLQQDNHLRSFFNQIYLHFGQVDQIMLLQPPMLLLAQLKYVPSPTLNLSAPTANNAEAQQIMSSLAIPINYEYLMNGGTFLSHHLSADMVRNIDPSLSASPIHYGNATIKTSLYAAALAAGLSTKQAMQLATILTKNPSFPAHILRGSKLHVLFQTPDVIDHTKKNKHNLSAINTIVAASIEQSGKTYTLVRFTDPKGKTDYYDPSGMSFHPTIVRAPLHYNHITSYFSFHRWQPILHLFRPHVGIDYAAPSGTPIMAAGNGRISFVGEEEGYGRTIRIQHDRTYSTLYAHLSRFAKDLHDNEVVHQGQIIGYVGDSGLSTGSHLHYEIRLNNVPHDPLSVALPQGSSIPKEYRAQFEVVSNQIMAELDNHQNQSVQLAEAEE